MALLHDLISRLSDEQLQDVKAMALPLREQQALDFVLSRRHVKRFSSALAQKRLSVTQAHFDKICSVILKKVVLLLAGGDAYDQFTFIRELRSRPPSLIRHQMKVAEKQITGNENFIRFYSECCEVVTRMSSTHMDSREIAYYTGRLLSYIDPKAHPEKYIKIKCDALYATISVIAMDLGIDDPHIRPKLQRKVVRLNNEARQLGHPLGQHHALRIAIMFFISSNQMDTALQYIDENMRVTDEHRQLFPEAEWLEPRLMHAECLGYAGHIQESYDIFCSLFFDQGYSKAIRLTSYTRFFKAAISLGHYDVARKLLDERFAFACEHQQPDPRIMAHLQYICYYQHTGDTHQADLHLTAARLIIDRQRQQQYYIQLLFFENTQLYLSGKFEEAKLQVPKNLKFLRSKNKNRGSSDYPSAFSAIVAVYDHHFSGQPFTARQQRDYDVCFQGSYSHFGGILQRMLAMKGNRKPLKTSASTLSEIN